ncbi:MAG: penicillin-binding protein 2, partial [Acidobacteriota bacterium]|nr:penicillin-binding protein 2 [Acidobacteriota bacterium]
KNNKYSEKGIGDLIGKTGIEKQYESILVGKKGKVLEIVDSSGRKKGELLREEPVKGKDIRLSLDFDLQKKAEDLLDGREGAIIVLSPKTGEILSMASYPSFDPNKFINRFSPEEWQEIASSPDFPLENRVIRGLYSPGSIFKLAMALAALDLNEITEKTSFICNGSILIYGHPFSCWYKPGHGPVNLTSAIQHSCNIYFYLLGKNLGIENIAKYAKEFGFGTKTGIDLPEEKNGLVPDPRWKEEVKKANWFPGETISISIGQGPLLVTPLQIADFTALIANRGKPVNPHLVIQEEKNEFKTSITREIQTKIDWSSKSILFEKVIEGMWKSVNAGGTGRLALIDGYDICGKTGSTQIISTSTIKKLREQIIEIKTHSWFTGFAPKDNPKVVVTVLVEYGGMGGQTAAPIARKLFTLFKEKYD